MSEDKKMKAWPWVVGGVMVAVVGVVAVVGIAKRDYAKDWDGRFRADSGMDVVAMLARPDDAGMSGDPTLTVSHRMKGAQLEVTEIGEKFGAVPVSRPGPVVRKRMADTLGFASGGDLKPVAILGYDLTGDSGPGPVWAMGPDGTPLEMAALKTMPWFSQVGPLGRCAPESVAVVFEVKESVVCGGSRLVPNGNPAEVQNWYLPSGFKPQGRFAVIRLPRHRVDAAKHSLFMQLYGGKPEREVWNPELGSVCRMPSGVEFRVADIFEWVSPIPAQCIRRESELRCVFNGKPGPVPHWVVQYPAGVELAAVSVSDSGGNPVVPVDYFVSKFLRVLTSDKKALPWTVSVLRESKRLLIELPPLPVRPEYAAADPLDWPIPQSFRKQNLRVKEVLDCMGGFYFSQASGARRLSDFPGCKTLRDVLREAVRPEYSKGMRLVVYNYAGGSRGLAVVPPEPPWWEQCRKWVVKTWKNWGL